MGGLRFWYIGGDGGHQNIYHQTIAFLLTIKEAMRMVVYKKVRWINTRKYRA